MCLTLRSALCYVACNRTVAIFLSMPAGGLAGVLPSRAGAAAGAGGQRGHSGAHLSNWGRSSAFHDAAEAGGGLPLCGADCWHVEPCLCASPAAPIHRIKQLHAFVHLPKCRRWRGASRPGAAHSSTAGGAAGWSETFAWWSSTWSWSAECPLVRELQCTLAGCFVWVGCCADAFANVQGHVFAALACSQLMVW